MKLNSPKHKSSLATKWWTALALLGLSSASLMADVVIEGRSGGQNTTWFKSIVNFNQTTSATFKLSPASGGTIGSYFASANSSSMSLTPTLISGDTYILYLGTPAAGTTSATRDAVYGITAAGCTGLPATTTAFQQPSGQTVDQWNNIGTLTPNTTTPTITFAYVSGSASRSYASAFWFKDIAGCATPYVGGIAGPLTNGQMVVDVTGCDPAATAVYVYTNNTGLLGNGTVNHASCIGTNSAPGGAATVTVTLGFPLVTGRHVQGNQLIGCEPQPPIGTGGPIVGSGANGSVNLVLEMTVDSTPLLWLGANNRNPAAYGAPPSGVPSHLIVAPSANWQTVTWTPGTDPSWNWGTAATYSMPNTGSGIINGIWVSSQNNNDMGPFRIYFDNIRNGNTVLYSAETSTLGNSDFLHQPSFAGNGVTPIQASPNFSRVVNDNASGGTNSSESSWEWTSTGPNSIRFMTNQASLPTPLAIDLSQSISMDVLLLPGTQTAGYSVADATTPANQSVCPNASVSFTVNVKAPGDPANYGQLLSRTYSYQWKLNGTAIDGATGTASGGTLSTDAATPITYNTTASTATAGTYSLVLTDQSTASLTRSATLTVKPGITFTGQPETNTVAATGGSTIFHVNANSDECASSFTYQWYHNGVLIAGATINDSPGSHYTINPVTSASAGTYTCHAVTSFGDVSSATGLLYFLGAGDGLRGDYWNATGAPSTANDMVNASLVNRVDNVDTVSGINFAWDTSSPTTFYDSNDTTINNDNFLCRWTGTVLTPANGNYFFRVTGYDGCRLWVKINGGWTNCLTSWTDASSSSTHGSAAGNGYTLSAGVQYPVILEAYSAANPSAVKLTWACSNLVSGVPTWIDLPGVLTGGTSIQAYPGMVISNYQYTSASAPITVPTVTLTAPSAGSAGTAPATIHLAATLGSDDGSAAITSITFRHDGTAIHTVNYPGVAGAYTYDWTAVPAGTYNISARVTYNGTLTVDTAAVQVTVASIVAPIVNPPAYNATTGNLTISGSNTGGVSQNSRLVYSDSLATPITWLQFTPDKISTGTTFSFVIPVGPTPTARFFKVQNY